MAPRLPLLPLLLLRAAPVGGLYRLARNEGRASDVALEVTAVGIDSSTASTQMAGAPAAGEITGTSNKTVLMAATNVARKGILMVSQIGKATLDRAALIDSSEHSWTRRMGLDDAHVYVVEEGAFGLAKARLKHVIALPDDVMPSCRHANGAACGPYETSSLKLPWATVALLEGKLQELNLSRPLWWLLKDDDTYVHVPNLRAVAARYDPSTKVMLAHLAPGCPGVCGGAGALLSWGLAEELVRTQGRRWIGHMVKEIASGTFYWDVHLPVVARWVPGTAVVDAPEMLYVGPLDAACMTPGGAWPVTWNCVEVPHVCQCAKAPNTATWHIKEGTTAAMAALAD